MNRDPIEALDAFYSECRIAPPPSELGQPRRPSFVIPVLGAALGIAAAITLAMFPAEPSPEACRRTAYALAQRQFKAAEPIGLSMKATPRKRPHWIA